MNSKLESEKKNNLDKDNPEKDDRSVQIIEATIPVLMEKGLAATSMNDIIKSSGLSKGGVYHYFSGKEALLIGVIEYFFQKHHMQLDSEAIKGSCYQALMEFMERHQEEIEQTTQYQDLFMDFYINTDNIPEIRQLFSEYYLTFRNQLADVIELGQSKGEFKPEVNAQAIASSIIGIFDGVSIATRMNKKDVKFPEFAIAGAIAVLNGIQTTK